jgi:hypothetical protein
MRNEEKWALTKVRTGEGGKLIVPGAQSGTWPPMVVAVLRKLLNSAQT